MRFSCILTSDQAALLYDLVKEHRAAIVEKWAYGIYDGLRQSLMQIDRGGGAYLRSRPLVLDYGGELIEATIMPEATYVAWPGVEKVPGPFLEPVAVAPELRVEQQGQGLVWRPVSVYRTKKALAMIPLVAAVLPTILPPLPLK
jgi:hypothetical protein